jgi:hypothetical protein
MTDRVGIADITASADLPAIAGRYCELKQDGDEWKACCPFHEERTPSFTLYRKEDKWRYHCFGCGAKGDAVDFLQAADGVERAEAIRRLEGDAGPSTPRPPATMPRVRPKLAAILPVPEGAPAMDPAKLWNPKREHHASLRPIRQWAYRDAAGRLLGYVLRCEMPDGKWTPAVTYTQEGWALVAFPGPRPLYQADQLAARPDRPVMVVEGEKAADAAQQLLPGWVVVTWPGGTNAVGMADWEPLAGRDVVVWPDADEPGQAAAKAITARLQGLAARVRLLDVDGQPKGWDAADAVEEGWTPARLVEFARQRVRAVEAQTPAKPAAPAEPTPAAVSVAPTAPANGVDYLAFLPDVNDKGRPMATIENLAEVCRRLGVLIRYNVISKEEEILVPGQGFSLDNRQNASLAWVLSECAKFKLPTGQVPDFVTYLADQHLYNPVAQWIQSKPWDGQDRFAALLDTVTVKGEDDDIRVQRMKRAFLLRWMVSAVAAAFRPSGVSAHGVLVFQGPQYVGKTKWFKQLVPADLGVLKDGLLLRPDDRDSVMKCVSNWLVELGELDATFRKADIASLKSFLTSDRDVLRRAYARKESTFARRTVFFASVNPKNYLHDETGNRRYWTVEVEKLDCHHTIDMQQCWAQVHAMYEAGESWYLTPEEFQLLSDHNAGFEMVDPVEDLVTAGLRWDDPETLWEWRTATEVLVTLGRKNCSRAETTKAGIILRRLNGDRSKRTMHGRFLLVPATRSSWGDTGGKF